MLRPKNFASGVMRSSFEDVNQLGGDIPTRMMDSLWRRISSTASTAKRAGYCESVITDCYDSVQEVLTALGLWL